MRVRKSASSPSLRTLLQRIADRGEALDDLRAGNGALIASVEAMRVAVETRLEALARERQARDATLELGFRELKVSLQQNGVDLRDLAAKLAALTRLEERVSVVERRLR